LIYTTEKSMKDMKGKVDEKKLKPLQDTIEELKKLMKDKEKNYEMIKKKLEEIDKLAQEAATELYQKAAAEQQAKQKAQAGKQAKGEKPEQAKDENIVDAEVVDEEEKK